MELRNRQHVQKVVADLFEQATMKLCNGVLLEQGGAEGSCNADVRASDGTDWESKAAYRNCWLVEREQLLRMTDLKDSQYVFWRYRLAERYTCRRHSHYDAGGLQKYCVTVEELQRYLVSATETVHIVPSRLIYDVTRQNARCWANAGRDGYRISLTEISAIIGTRVVKPAKKKLHLAAGKLSVQLFDLRVLPLPADDIPF